MPLPPTPRSGWMNFRSLSLWENAKAGVTPEKTPVDMLKAAAAAPVSFMNCRLVILVAISFLYLGIVGSTEG
jgi:hypothetical protein